MLTQIENNKGIISFDNAIIDQIISEALSKYRGCFRFVKKNFEMHEEGVNITISLLLKFGTSISEFSNHVLTHIANVIENSLELPVNSIKLNINGVYSKKLSKRDIEIEYNNRSEITNNMH